MFSDCLADKKNKSLVLFDVVKCGNGACMVSGGRARGGRAGEAGCWGGGLWPLPCLLVVLGGGQGAGRLGQAEARGTAVLMVGGVAVRR